MAFKVTVNGVDKTSSISADRGASISMPLNGRATMRFVCLPGFEPSKRHEVVAYEQDGVTKLFGGVIVQRRAVSGTYGTTPMFTECECGDFSTYADWCYQTKTYTTSKTLKEVLTDLVTDKLDDYGIALDAGQVNGPTLSAFAWEDKRVSDCLRELSDKTGYVYRVDADKKLKMFVPGTDAAPFSVTDATPNVQDISWDDSTETPANKVTLRCGPDGVGSTEITHTWTADGGVTTVFDLSGLNVPASSVWPGSVLVDAVSYPMWPPGAAPGGNGIEWDYATNDGTISFLGTSTSLINATQPIVLTYFPQYPFVVSDDTGATPIIEKVYRVTDVTTYDAAVDLAAGLIDQIGQEPRTLRMPSLEDGCAPGDSLTVNVTTRSINATCTITQVDIELITSGFWRYTLTAQEATVIQADYLGQWRQLTGGTGSGGVSSIGAASVSGSGVTGTGTTGKLPKWLSSDILTDSIISESGSALTVAGSVEATAMTIGGAYVYRVGGTDVAVADGGTGLSSYAVGDLLYASAATTLAKLASVAAGSYLRSGGVTTAPVWSTLTLPNTITSGYVPYATGTNVIGSGSGLTYNGSAFSVTGTGSFTSTLSFGGGSALDSSTKVVMTDTTQTVTGAKTFSAVNTIWDAGATSGGAAVFRRLTANVGVVGAESTWRGSGSSTYLAIAADASNGVRFFVNGSSSIGAEFNANGNFGVGVASGTISARIHAISSSEQLRVGYDASNYFSTTVSSAGAVTFNAVGTSAGFTFSDPIVNSAVMQASPFTDTPLKILGSAADNTGYAGIAYRVSSTTDNYGWTAGAARGADADQGSFQWRFHVNSAAGTTLMRLTHGGLLGVGVDPSAAIHVLSTTEQLRVAYDASNYFSTTVSSAGLVTFNAVGAGSAFTFSDQINPSASVIPTTNYVSNLGSLANKYLTLHAAELVVETLVAQDTMATIGGRIIVAPTTTLTADLTAVATSIQVKHNNLANGDRVRLESNGKIEWMAITSVAGGSAGAYTYSVTRDLDGTGANVWYAGDAVLNTGTTGDGFIDLYSTSGVLSGSGPTIVGNARTGTTYSDVAARWAIGNLNGLYGYVADTYGAAFGDPSNAWIKVDATNGVRIGHNATTKIELTAAGDASFSGAITAASGTIGGWTIGAQQLSAGSGASFVGLNSTAGTVRLWAGSETATSAPWRVTEAGVMTAIGATIQTVSGTGARVELTSAGLKGYDATTMRFSVLTDGSGTLGTNGIAWTTAGVVTVGGWTVSSTRLSSGSGASYVAMDGTAGTIRIWAGNETAGSAPFRVTEAGALTATSATITGAITATSGSITGDLTVGTSGLLRSGATDYATGTGWILDYNGGTPRFRVGTTAANRLTWDGTTMTLVSETVTINASGITVLTETGVGADYSATGSYKFGTDWGMYGYSDDTASELIKVQAATHARLIAGTVSVAAVDYTTTQEITLTASGTTTTGRTTLTGEITPTALSGNTDNWNPTGLSSARCIRISASAAYNLTGITAQADGTEIFLLNVGANAITLKHDVTSTAANRFYFAGGLDVSLNQYRGLLLRYDGTMDRWVAAL